MKKINYVLILLPQICCVIGVCLSNKFWLWSAIITAIISMAVAVKNRKVK